MPVPLASGSRVDAYELLRPIGRGGMGEVWLAREVHLRRKVALKLLPSDLTRDTTRVKRFQQEARAASALSHPNVCVIHALGMTADSQHYIAMEYVEGRTLRARLVHERLTLREALDIAIQIASALTAAHASGVVHRDIKPENVMLRPDGFVKVLDFGLAKLTYPTESDAAQTTRTAFRSDAGTVVGTVAYMSPEQARGDSVDARTDIWSVGVVLYEMVAGRSPFAAASRNEVVAAILDRAPAPLARFEPRAPAELQRIVTKALRKSRKQRYQTTQDLLLDLQALRQAPLSPATSTDGSPLGPGNTAVTPGVRSQLSAVDRTALGRSNDRTRRPLVKRVVVAIAWSIVAVSAIGLLGLIATLAFDSTVGRPVALRNYSPLLMWKWGLKLLVAPFVYILIATFVVEFSIRLFRLARTISRSLDQVIRSLSAQGSEAAEGIGWDTTLSCQITVLLQLGAVVWIFSTFGDLAAAGAGTGSIAWAPVSRLQPLQPAFVPRHVAYGFFIDLTVAASVVIWWHLLVARRRRGLRVDSSVIAGMMLIAAPILMWAASYRVIWHNEMPRAQFAGERCYITGETNTQVFLYCPDVPPPRDRVISSRDERLLRTQKVESIFSP